MSEVTQSNPSQKPLGSLWRSRDFLKLWGGQTISILGSHITGTGLPLLAVMVLQASPFQMGLMQAVSSAPVLLFSLLAGVWVDRLNRRPLMIASDLGRMALLATIPLAAILGRLSIWQIYIVLALTGLLDVLFRVAYNAYLPSLVEPERIIEGNARLAVSESAAEIVGPGLGGLLVQTITAPIAILYDALSFLVSAATLALIQKPEPPLPAVENRQSAFQEAREGILAIAGHPILRALAGAEAMANFFGSFIGVLYILYAVRILNISPAGMGITIGVGGASSLLGALLAERIGKRIRLGRLMLGALWVHVLFCLLIPLAASFPGAGFGFLVASQLGDIAHTIYSINSISLRQSITPGRLLGRVNASNELLTEGIGPLGALAGGLLGSLFGIQATLFIAVTGIALSSLLIFFSPIRSSASQVAAHS